MGLVRASRSAVVRDPEIEGRMTVIDPSIVYDSKHPLVKAYPDEFNDVTADVVVESATRAPGEKRLGGRSKVGEEKAAGRPLTSQDNPKA